MVGPTEGSPVVEINAGGVTFHTSTVTLGSGKAQNTTFSRMFTTEGALPKDERGRLFLDRDPEIFGVILNSLRNPQNSLRRPPTVAIASLMDELKFYGLQSLISEEEMRTDVDASHLLANANDALRDSITHLAKEAFTRVSRSVMQKKAGTQDTLFPEQGETQQNVNGLLFGDQRWKDRTLVTKGFLDGERIVAGYSKVSHCVSLGISSTTCEDIYFITNLGRYGNFGSTMRGSTLFFPREVTVTGDPYPLTTEYVSIAQHVVSKVRYLPQDPRWTAAPQDTRLWDRFMETYRARHPSVPNLVRLNGALRDLTAKVEEQGRRAKEEGTHGHAAQCSDIHREHAQLKLEHAEWKKEYAELTVEYNKLQMEVELKRRV